MPETQVQAAPQRNQYRARGISSGTTFLLESASYVLATWLLTKLKKYRWPIHAIPATAWIQRKSMSSHALTFGSMRDLLLPPVPGREAEYYLTSSVRRRA